MKSTLARTAESCAEESTSDSEMRASTSLRKAVSVRAISSNQPSARHIASRSRSPAASACCTASIGAPVLEVPPRRARVQLRDPGALRVPELGAEQLGEKVVVAVPGRLRLDAVDEEVLGHEALGHVRAVGAAGHRVGEIRREALGDRGREQEVANVVGLPPQHFGKQVLGRRTLVEGERLENRRVRVARATREHEQPQPCRPALGADEQRREGLRVDPYTQVVEERARLVGREGEIAGAKLGELAARAQEMQRQHRVVPRREDEPQRGRRGAQELVERRGDLEAVHRVEVVDHHDDRLLQLRKAVEELQDEARRRPRARRRDPRQRRPRRHDALDRREPLDPERSLAESAARREPRDVERLGREPRREQRRLAEAGGRRDQRQGTLSPLVQALD